MVSVRLFFAALACFALLAGKAASAQSYPNRTVKIIVPFGPGSGSDIVARQLAQVLQERWQQAVIVDNRPGAQGLIATELLKIAKPDGYTLGISTNSTHAAAPHLVKQLAYDPIADFEHIALIGVGGSVAVVRRESEFKTIAELAAYAKKHPGKVFFGHADTSSQMPSALLQATAGIPIEAVPYKTSGNMLTDLMSGQIQFAFFNYMTGHAQVAGGRLVPIAITEAKRNPRWPGVPTVAETYPGYEVGMFVGVSGPRGVPPAVLAEVHRAIQAAQSDAKFSAPLQQVGLTFVRQALGEYRAFIVQEHARWRELVSTAKLAPK